VTDRSTDDPGGAGQRRYPVGEAKTLPGATFKRKKLGGITFILQEEDSHFRAILCS
jgi:hypothetical protein